MILILDFALAVLASIGFSNLIESPRVRYGHALVIVTAALCGWGIWRVHKLQAGTEVFLDSPAFTTILLMISLGIVLLRLSSHLSSRAFATLIVSVTAIDVFSFSFGFVPFVPVRSIFPVSPVFSFLKESLAPGERIGIIDDAMPVNVGMMYGIRSIDGYDFRLLSNRDLFSDFDKRGPIGYSQAVHSTRLTALLDRRLDMMAVKYFVAANANEGPEALRSDPTRFRLAYSFGSIDIFENRLALKPVNLVSSQKIEILTDPEEQLHRLKSIDFDPASSAIVGELPKFFPSSSHTWDRSAVDQVNFLTTGEIRVRAEVAGSSVLVVSEAYYPGWRVKVDGVPQTILRVNVGLMGVGLGPGVHDVRFEFSSTMVHAGIAISILTLIMCAILLSAFANRKPAALHV
jgi:hypothetical protein